MQARRKIRLSLQRLAVNLFEGIFPSSTSGARGLELDEIREYQPGDDLRSIDWKTTVRARKLHVRVRLPDRRVPVLFLIDKSGSKRFGASKALKEDALFSVLSLLVAVAGEAGNPMGLIVFTDRVERYFPPRLGQTQVLRLLPRLKEEKTKSPLTDLDSAFSFVNGLNLPPSLIVILSDFLTAENYEVSLGALSKRHEIIPIVIKDKREEELPRAMGFLTVRDMESRELGFLDLASSLRQGLYYLDVFRRLGLDHIEMCTHESEEAMADELSAFFEKRARNRRAVRR